MRSLSSDAQASIIGMGSYLPKKVLTNFDLEKMIETSNEWILSRTGIQERRIAETDEATSYMGCLAAQRAIQDADIEKSEIDFIIVATLTPDHIIPSAACLVQNALGLKEVPAIDIQAACSGYMYALSIAKSFVEKGTYQNILVIASEKLSSIVNYQDPSTCILFGDGAAAAVISKKKRGFELRGVSLGADGAHANLLMVPAGGSKHPASSETVRSGMHYIKMAGNEVFKHAVRRMEEASKVCLEMLNMKQEEISWLIPHQANSRIISAIARRFQHLPDERICRNIVEKYGNTAASSVGIALDEFHRERKIQKGENVLLTVFGSGFTWGAAVVTYLGE